MPASACKVVGHTKSGEKLCMKTSDGKGEVYKKDDRPIFVPDDRPVFVPDNRPIFVPDDRPVFVPPKHKAQQAHGTRQRQGALDRDPEEDQVGP